MNDALIDRFCDHLWLEDGLADLTLAAYRRDLKTFGAWLEKERAHGDCSKAWRSRRRTAPICWRSAACRSRNRNFSRHTHPVRRRTK
ncbi:MAG: site-specific integrase, partial [Candidatus Thermoplasmatota archaeon]|nr:site-specific integrase [Candidatus Thermoplasmatota archaeon]